MKRRRLLLGGLGLGAAALGGGLVLRPDDDGAPHDPYFGALNQELKKNGPMRPCLLIDLDRLDHNIDRVVASVSQRAGRHYRIVEKSLPSPGLIEYVMRRAASRRLMSFHQPFLNQDAVRFPDADILLGKPLPVRSAERFYRELKGPFDAARQLQWLVDTPERIAQY
ncbi:MAG: DSD1 family PLP-dependent enzyme, partial [Panacagrimonas sp.]